MSYREGGNYRPNSNYQPHRSGTVNSSFQKNNRYGSRNQVNFNNYSNQYQSHNGQYQSNYQNQGYQTQQNFQNTAPRNNYDNKYQNNSSNQYQNQNYQSRGNNYPTKAYSGSNNSSTGYNNGSQQDKKYDPFQLWMGDLDLTWDEQVLMNIWTSVGEAPSNIKIMRDKAGIKLPYGFISFKDQDLINSAFQKNGQQIPGWKKYFKLNWASGGPSGGTNQNHNNYTNFTQSTFPAKNGFNLNQFEKIQSSKADNTSCFIGDLPLDVTEPFIFEKFNKKYPNQVRQVRIMTDPVTRTSRGFGFVKFNSQEIAKQAALEMNGIIIGSKPIKVSPSTNTNSTTTSTLKLEVKTHIAQSQPPLNQFTDANNTNLIIKNLNQKFTPEELKLHFLAYGDIIYCKLSNDRTCGYIKYYLRSAAELALLNLHGMSINNCNLKITWGKEPYQSNIHKKSTPSPTLYGQFKPFHVDLSSSDTYDQLIEPSESLPIANQLYISSKLNRDKILDQFY